MKKYFLTYLITASTLSLFIYSCETKHQAAAYSTSNNSSNGGTVARTESKTTTVVTQTKTGTTSSSPVYTVTKKEIQSVPTVGATKDISKSSPSSVNGVINNTPSNNALYYSNGSVSTSTVTTTNNVSVKLSKQKEALKNQSPGQNNNNVLAQEEKVVKQSSVKAGLLTGGETNDLGKWDLWSDMVKEALDKQINLWNMHPYRRYAVLIQTEDGMPVHGANVALLNKNKKVIWEAVTDNTGSAQLWAGMFEENKDTIVSSITIEYKKTKEVINSPIPFKKGINTKKLKVNYHKSKNVDIAFVVDATASMGDEIEFLKEELTDIITKTQNKYEDINLKLGSVFYRCEGNEYTTRIITLTNEHSAVTDFIKEQQAKQGGTEAVEIAFDDALNKLNWREDARTRLLFFVLDEPSGYTKEVIEKLHQNIQLAAKKGVKVIPVVASGSGTGIEHDRNLEFLMRSSALATNGNYIFISDHSGIGGKHTEPIIDNYEVELINDIITRTIENNIYMPEKVKPNIEEEEKDTLYVNNEKEVVNKYIDSLMKTTNDSTLLAQLLQYSDFETMEELMKHIPIKTIDTTSLVKDKDLEVHTLKIYPNPSHGQIKAEFNCEVEWLYLADLSGKILNRINVQGQKLIDIDLNEYPSGIYMVQYPDEKKWISAKIVLQK